MTTVLPEKRPLRDAAQHREQLLEGAAQLFATQGLSASLEEIARVAGVGMGTLYRRFPTKEALIEELVREQLSEVIEAATAAKRLPDGLGWRRFSGASANCSRPAAAVSRGCGPRRTPPISLKKFEA